MYFLLFLLDDRRIRIRISDKLIRIREAKTYWILRIRIRNTAQNYYRTNRKGTYFLFIHYTV
jgi:hypothetical protein